MNPLKLNLLLFYLFFFYLLQTACKNDRPVDSLEEITINEAPSQGAFGDKLEITGILSLDTNNMSYIGHISDLEWLGNDLIAVQFYSAIEKMYVFDGVTGKFKNQISRLGEGPTEYNGLLDIVLSGDKIRAIVTGKMAFMDFDIRGNCLANIRTNIFGTEIELLDNNNFVVYNENNRTDESGFNYILIYNEAGKLKKRMAPYLSARDGMGFMFTGFLERVGDGVYFSPPFSDTIFRVSGEDLIPAYHFNFIDAVIPGDLRKSETVFTGANMAAYGYLDEIFIKIRNNILFRAMYKNRFFFGIYDEQSKNLINGLGYAKAEKIDLMAHLISWSSTHFQKDADTFVSILTPQSVEIFRNDKRFTPDDWNALYPGLYDIFKSVSFKSNPVLLYFKFK